MGGPAYRVGLRDPDTYRRAVTLGIQREQRAKLLRPYETLGCAGCGARSFTVKDNKPTCDYCGGVVKE